jgi:amino acid adenylation domain-containing protein
MNIQLNDPRLPDSSSAQKRAALSRLFEGQVEQAGGVFPLSLTQERLWFLNHWEPGSPAYNSRMAVRFDGPLDVHALEQTVNEIVRRHEVLRTTFNTVGGRPVQVVAPHLTVPLPVDDLSGLPEAERLSRALLEATTLVRQPVDLARGPLVRCRLLRLAAQEHILVFMAPHIVCDEWSLAVIVRELSALYPAFRAGLPSPLAELPIQYADYALWQREWLRDEVLDGQLDYWKKQLGGALPVLQLPTDHPRPAVHGFQGARQSLRMPPELAEQVRALARREGVTPFLAYLSAFYVLLYRYTQQEDVVVGCPVALRNRPEVEDLIGFFVNTLALRGDLSGQPTFRQLLGRLKDAARGAYAHQEVPFEKVVEAVRPDRDPGRSPLFQVMFVLFNDVVPELQLPGLRLTPLDQLDTGAVKFDLVLTLSETSKALEATFRYRTELFDASTIERMLGHFQTLLEGIVAEPDRPVAQVSLLRPAEVEQLLVEFNDTRADLGPERCVHQLIEAQAERTPAATALSFAGQSLTYDELNEQANQVARYLQELGVGPEVRVGLFMERSLEMVVGLLGILKAGGAYVPLDPAYPANRLALMLEDADAAVLLAQQHLVGRLPERRPRVVCIDADRAAIGWMPRGNPQSGVAINHLAYLLYTSGSTGRPKGVMIEHRGLGNLARGQSLFFEIGPESRVLQFASISFDASVSEIVTALTQGATLVLAPAEVLRPGPALVSLLREEAISVVTLPPSVLAVLPTQEVFPELKTLVVAGEACPAELVERWGRGRRFVNGYGPTEATVCATLGLCRPGPRPPSIGKPLANTQAFVLDPLQQLVPVGVPGELYVGGVGLARGYLNRPDLTTERFVSHPMGAGWRLYRTGDRVRWLPNGELEFLGRIDYQVKVRGFRIETEEVEAALCEHANVREAVVMALENGSTNKRLAAYVVGRGKPEPSPVELRGFLHKRLPEYMIPQLFFVLDALPLGPNGKVDRRALPSPKAARSQDRAREYAAPRNPLEAYLQGRWQEVLGLERVGIHENFFDLGGDSLVAAMLIFKLQEAFGEPLYVVALFKGPTIAELAAYLLDHYPDAVRRVCGMEVARADSVQVAAVGEAEVAELRSLIPPLPARPARPAARKNPPAVFVLSPPRSGSTLLRVILAGHRHLFAPPELELLSFNTLAQRRDALSGQYSFWLEGTIRAVMEARGCTADEAREFMEDCQRRGLSVREFYGRLQEWIAPRTLVDKTPAYALDTATLRRAEEDFDRPLYLHLLRHPCAMIRSFEGAKLDQVFFRHPHPFSPRQLAELIWVVSQQNIREFLQTVPANRHYQVRFEDLVRRPRPVLEGVCGFLGLDFDPEMLQPYHDRQSRMTDGFHPLSKMLGDVKFHQHQAIDAEVADRWHQGPPAALGGVTQRLAAALGYREPAGEPAAAEPARPPASINGSAAHAEVPVTAPRGSLLVPLQPLGKHAPLFCVHPPGGVVFPYADLAARLRPDYPLYAFQGRGLDGTSTPHESLEEMAADYVAALRAVQPHGPYHLGGWSLGGTVAYEMACQLAEAGQPVGLVALFDTGMSAANGRDEPTDLERARFIVGMARVHGLELPLEKVRSLRPAEQLQYVAREVARAGLLPAEVLPYPIERVLALQQAHVQAAMRYRRRHFPGKVTLFKCSVDLDPLRGPKAEDYGWCQVAAEVEVVRCPGSHRNLLREPHAGVTAERLKECVDRAQQGGGRAP